MTGMHVTLNAIRKKGPCQDGWVNLLAHLGKTKADDEPLRLSTILDSNGLDDCYWCFRALAPEYDRAARLHVCDIAERALRSVPEGEERPRIAIETARKYAAGEASEEEMAAANAAAWIAVDAAWIAVDAAWAAWAAANASAFYAVMAARGGAADADAERAEQEKILRAWLETMEGESQ